MMTLVCFILLPLIQSITAPIGGDTIVQTVAMLAPPPPPPVADEVPEEEPEQEEEPPELTDDAPPPLDLSQLELALNPGMGGEGFLPDMSTKLLTVSNGGSDKDALFSMSDLDQKPRVLYQPSPLLTAKHRRLSGGTVYIIFILNERGRVENAKIQRSPNPDYDVAALQAIKKWRFEPGKKSGKAVKTRMRVPITFPKGR